MDNVDEIKVVFLGASGVGKSSILQRFGSGTFASEIPTTLGASFVTKKMVVKNKTIKFQIWDTAGQEKYHAISQMYYRDAGAAIIVFDVTNRQSYDDMKTWREEVQEKGPPGIIIAVVGNKTDLLRSIEDLEDLTDSMYKPVDLVKAKRYAEDNGALFLTASARFDKGIQDIFTTIGERSMLSKSAKINNNKEKDKDKSSIILRDEDNTVPIKLEERGRSCC